MIEGLDGSGKSTQLNLIQNYLEEKGVKYRYLHFPRLEEGVYGKLIARFLRGEMGANEQVDPYLVALIFAGDRAAAAPMVRSWIEAGDFVIVDRYVYSNIAFQGAKLPMEERAALRDWILELEFEENALPRPDINLLLDVPMDFTRRQLAAQRSGEDRSYLKGARDIHEESMSFQEEVRKVYLGLEQHVDDLQIISCVKEDGSMMPAGSISEKLIKSLSI